MQGVFASLPKQIRYYSSLALLIAIPRLIYALAFNNEVHDSSFYIDISKNIIRGCGFSMTGNSDTCIPVAGGYFPGYPYFLSLLLLIGLNTKAIISLVTVFITLSIMYFNATLVSLNIKKSHCICYTLLLGLSPLSLGYSRFLLIEPILYFFSILLLSELLNLFNSIRNKKFIIIRIALIQILSIYFKPTTFLFLIPISIALLISLDKRIALKKILSIIIAVFLSIFPWGLREISLGAKIPFLFCSQACPANINGYINWLSTFNISEYDHARHKFPIFNLTTGDRRNINISTSLNPFISEEDSDLAIARSILYKQDPEDIRGFTKTESNTFDELAIKRREELTLLGNLSLYSLKIISILTNPFNSWGLPLELNMMDFNLQLLNLKFITSSLHKITFKLLLFVYRIFLYLMVSIGLYKLLGLFFNLRFSSINKLYSFSNLTLILSTTLMVSNIWLYVIKYDQLEHRYLYPFMPWLEVAALSVMLSSTEDLPIRKTIHNLRR